MTSQIYKIIINNRNYDSGSWSVSPSNLVEGFTLMPLDAKLFSGDTFSYDSINGVTIVESDIRMKPEMPAVLVIAGNKTYGRHPTNNKLLYKCVPDDVSLPPFLVPYEIKNMGFSKVFVNLFVTIKFASWDNKHPFGTLTQVIGPVDVCESFYEYQLYCKNLNTSLTKFNKACNKSLQDNKETFVSNVTDKGIIEDRTDWQVFTIDPQGSLDFDDAFSIKSLDNGNTLISIYIANVVVCLERLNLWSELTKRTSTIYLPDKKRTMLPIILSDCLCSLQADAPRYAFTLDLEIDAFGTIVSKRFINCIIKVFKNFAYEERSLLRHPLYKCLLKSVTNLVTKYPYIKLINDSHDVVCYLMILMNHLSAKEMLGYNMGIFRSATINEVETNAFPSDDVNQFIKIWRGSNCKYIDIATNTESLHSTKHDILELDAYIHITSPIRRLVDILNMIKFQECANLYKLSDAALDFYNVWSKDIDFINTTMKMTRRVQNDCNLLGMCNNNPDILEKSFDGYCFDETTTDNGFYKYNVYLPDLKITLNIVSDKSLSYEKKQFKLFVFNNEEKMKKKIRLHLL
jgi:exoribonuclease R